MDIIKANQRTDFETTINLEELKLDMSDEDIKQLIKSWISLSGSSEKILLTNAKENKNYYIGIDTKTEDILEDESKVTDNRIFTNIETVVPLVTSTPAKPIVFIPSSQGKDKTNKEKIRNQAIKTQKILLAVYEDQKLQHKYEKLIRQHQIYRIGMFKYGISDDKIFAEVVLPSRLLLDSDAVSIEDSEFVGEKVVTTIKKLIDKYPNKEKEIKEYFNEKKGTKITYYEWWTDDMMIVSLESQVILEAKKNPLFDYTGQSKTTYDEFGKEIKGEPTRNNFFDRPKKPYIVFNVYNIGENIIDDVTCLELSKTLQDEINDRKRQISNNANKVGNPIRGYRGFTADQSAQANENLRAGDGVNLTDEQDIFYIQAAPLPAHINNDLQDSRNSIDNIFGIHSTTRGERQAGAGESGRAREALREGDEDRQATIGRAVEQVSEELYNAFAHLIKVFYDKDELLPIMGEKNAEEYVQFKRDDIAEGMKIRVKPGSTIPEDKNAIKAQGLELLGMGAITKRRAFEMLGMEDAEEAAQELELEGVKAQQAQQKILQEEQKQQANSQLMSTLEDKIANLQ